MPASVLPAPVLPDPDTARAARIFVRHLVGRYPVKDVVLFGSRAISYQRPMKRLMSACSSATASGASARVSAEDNAAAVRATAKASSGTAVRIVRSVPGRS